VVPDRETLVDGVKVTYFSFLHALEFLAPTGWQFSIPMKKALEQNLKGYDLVYILSVWNYPVIMAASVCRKFNKPYIISPRGLLYPETFGKKALKKRIYYELLVKKWIREAVAVHYTSLDEAEKCHNRLSLKNRAMVAPNGIDLSEFADLPDKNGFLSKYPALKNKKILLFLGRISWKKGLDILVRAFDILSKERADLRLVIAGGDEENYKSKIADLIDRAGLRDKVIFTGLLNGREKLGAYAAGDIFVLPSYSENFGMSVVEAMACGLPVVISDKVGIHREVRDGEGGVVVETNAGSVEDGIRKLLEDEKLRCAVAENGRFLARELYDIDKVADKMILEFEKIGNA
jgi:glycosyltransferase involved in cell wall biosynthesis